MNEASLNDFKNLLLLEAELPISAKEANQLQCNGFCELNETKKIIDNEIDVTATCVRVPVRTGHSESINIEFDNLYDFENVIKILSNAPGCKVIDERKDGGYITPIEAEGDYTTYISRIRKDNSNVKAINIWVVSDNLLKGAALNTVQIAEHLVKKL